MTNERPAPKVSGLLERHLSFLLVYGSNDVSRRHSRILVLGILMRCVVIASLRAVTSLRCSRASFAKGTAGFLYSGSIPVEELSLNPTEFKLALCLLLCRLSALVLLSECADVLLHLCNLLAYSFELRKRLTPSLEVLLGQYADVAVSIRSSVNERCKVLHEFAVGIA